MVREGSNLLSLKGVDTEFLKGNLTSQDDLRRAVAGCRVVVHAAAKTSQTSNSYKPFRLINVEATLLLLEESLKAGVERFVFIGSANAFGLGTKTQPADEFSSFDGVVTQSNYARSKYEAQQLTIHFGQKTGLPIVVVNPTFMLGKYDSKPSSGQILKMAYGKRLMFAPLGGKNFIHVEDVTQGILSATENGTPGECYLLGNENLNYGEFFLKMKSVYGYPKHVVSLPKSIITLTGHAGHLFEWVTGKAVRLNPVNAQLLNTCNFYSSAKAIQELKLPQTPVEKAIQDALGWFEVNGLMKSSD